MIKQADQIGASLLGRVEPRMAGTSFSSADRGGYAVDSNNHLLQNLINRGIKVLDKTIDAELENEMIKGATQAMAGVAEENLETSILTKNFTVAGHRNMTAKMHHQSWQAQIVDEIAKGEHNDLSPTEFGAYLNQSMQEVLNDVNGMSMDAKTSMLETMLTGNQSLIAKQTENRAKSIVDTRMQLYGIQANNLLTEGQLNMGTAQESATVQQVQALVRDIYSDPNLPQDVKLKLITELQQGSAKMGLVEISKGVLNAPVVSSDGTMQYYGSVAGIENFTKGVTEVNKALDKDRWLNNQDNRIKFADFKDQLEQGTYVGTREDVINFIRFGRMSKSISEGEANTLFKTYLSSKYLNDNLDTLSNYWFDNNITGISTLGKTMEDGKKAFIKRMVQEGLTIPEQIQTATSAFTDSNGSKDIVGWIGSDILKPLLGEVIHSEGAILTDNNTIFYDVTQQVDKMKGLQKEMYVTSLLSALDPLQSGFMLEYIGQREAGASEQLALATARQTYQDNSRQDEAKRNKAVQSKYKAIEEAKARFSDPSSLGNFMGMEWIASKVFGSDAQTVKLKAGTPSFTPWTTDNDDAVRIRAGMLGTLSEAIAQDFVRANPNATDKQVEREVASKLRNKIRGNDNPLVFRGKSDFRTMFPNAPQSLYEQQDDVIDYVLSKVDLGNDAYNKSTKVFSLVGDLLIADIVKDGRSISVEVPPSQYREIVDGYLDHVLTKTGIYKDEGTEWDDYVNAVSESQRMGLYTGGKSVSFKYEGYDNKDTTYTPMFMQQIYEDNLPLEGWRLKPYKDDPRGGNRVSVGMGVNSGNRKDPRYKPYFDIIDKKGSLTQSEAEALTELAVSDHLRNSADLIKGGMGKQYLGVSEDLELAMFKLSYAQWRGGKESTDKILQGVKDRDVSLVIDGLQTSRFFRDTAGGNVNHPQYQYVLRKLIGAINDINARGIR